MTSSTSSAAIDHSKEIPLMRMDSWFKYVLLFVFAVASLGGARAQGAALPNNLDLYGGQVLVFKSSRPIDRVAVGNGDMLQVTTIDKRQLVLIAAAGQNGYTELHLWYEDGGERSVQVKVSPGHGSSTSSLVREMLSPESAAKVVDLDGKVLVTGELTDKEAARLEAIAQL